VFNPNPKHKSTEKDVIVAVRDGRVLATAFHPELTQDLSWHSLFLDIVKQNKDKNKNL